MGRRRLEADGDALEMLSKGRQAYLQSTTVVHCRCPRVQGRGHWTDGNADGDSTDLEPSAEEVIRVWLTVVVWTREKRGLELANTEGDQQLHYRKVGLLLVGYLMQCHEAHQAPNQHRREEGRRTSNVPGTCQFGTLWSAVHQSLLSHLP